MADAVDGNTAGPWNDPTGTFSTGFPRTVRESPLIGAQPNLLVGPPVVGLVGLGLQNRI